MSILDFWQALEPVVWGSGVSSTGVAAFAGGSATTKRPDSSAGRDPGHKDSSTPPTFPAPILAYEDNQTTIAVLDKEYPAKLTHISRTHRFNMHWLREMVENLAIPTHYFRSEKQTADIFTKAFLHLEPYLNPTISNQDSDPASWARR